MSQPNPSGGGQRSAKRRRNGYRGYGSPLREDHCGVVHWGRGFAGVGFPGESGGLLPPDARILPENLRAENSHRESGSEK